MLFSGRLCYAGTLITPFLPDKLKVDTRGYLYHPSPPTPQASSRARERRRKRSTDDSTSPKETAAENVGPASRSNQYGDYSLLRSQLVTSKLAQGLELHENGSGSYEWLGERYDIQLLHEPERISGTSWKDEYTSEYKDSL